MSATQDPTQSGGASTLNFLADSDTSTVPADPVASDLPSDFFAQISDSRIEPVPAPEEAAASVGQTYFAHTVDASASVLGAPSAPAAPAERLVIELDETETAALEPQVSVATQIRIDAAPADDAAILASILSVSPTPSVSATASTDPSVDDVYRDMVRKSLSSERAQGGISRVRTYAVALLALVLGGGGLYAYSTGMVSFVSEDEPVILNSAPAPAPVTVSTGDTSTGSASSGSVASDAPSLDLMRRDSGTIANKKRNNSKKRTVATGSTVATGTLSASR